MAEAVLSWSGGKDCAFALHVLRDTAVRVVELFTTIDRERDRSAMHGVRRELYERQADALGLPLTLAALPPEPSNAAYERLMADAMARYRDRGIGLVVFADLFLEDVRAYREDRLDGTGIDGCWPLWGRDSASLAADVLDAGFDPIAVAADAARFEPGAVGRPFDEAFLADLPDGVDPCGEDGAFHTFVTDGPCFEAPVPVEVGATVTRPVGDGSFHYADLVPVGDVDE